MTTETYLPQIITIYTKTCTQAYMASCELGTGYSLTPWGNDTIHYTGYDDGGVEYILPPEYELCEMEWGSFEIFRRADGTHCHFFTENNRPAIINADGNTIILSMA